MIKLPSDFQIDYHVMYDNGFDGMGTPIQVTGKVVAVRFTKTSVQYDILNIASGEVEKNIQESRLKLA